MRFFVRMTAPYAAAVLSSLVILALLMEAWRLDLTVPLVYRLDALLCQVWTRSILDHGWYLNNPQLAAPALAQMHDFPTSDSLHFAIIKLLGYSGLSWPVIFNAYYLLTFPLTALTSLFVLRQLGIKGSPAFVASQLYAFLPYHWNRGEIHLFLAAYYVVPLSILVAVWICLGLLGGAGEARSEQPPAEAGSPRKRFGLSLLICGLQASAGVYYAFFASFLFLVAAMAACWRNRSLRPGLPAALLVAVTIAGVAANTAPSLLYWHREGANPEVATRSLKDTEIFALKLAPLLLPVEGHNLPPLARLRWRYNSSSLLVNENASATLGVVGGVGFLVMLGWSLFGRSARQRHPLVDALSTMNLALVLLATSGGFGALFSLLVHSQIRAYNRASVFIAFFALATVAVGLDWLGRRCLTAWSRGAMHLSLAILLAAGILDQSSFNVLPVPDWEAEGRRQFAADAEFVARMEAALPPNAAVYQLPYAEFPEGLSVHLMDAYEHFRPYLHSRSLRFSHGAMRGRDADRWHRSLDGLPVDKLVDELERAGFQAIYIDRRGYGDGGRELETKLRERLCREPLESKNGDRTCFVLSPPADGPRVATDRRPSARLSR
jgi:phosphoglycerol transferase